LNEFAPPRQLNRSAQLLPPNPMSFGIAILLSEKKLPIDKYRAFVDACTCTIGEWNLHQVEPLNLNAPETIHDFSLANGTHDRVWVNLERREFIRKYGRGRRKIFWQIYLETKAGRDAKSLALQFLIPVHAFTFFENPVVVVEFIPEKVFLERKNYEMFAQRQIALECGEQFMNNLALQ
jgi:hypothetical protein